MHGIEVINKMNAMKDPDTFVLTGVGERLYPNKVNVEEEHRARVSKAADKRLFNNFYHCPVCDEKWEDEWDSTCNDHCPGCDAEIEPYHSDRVLI